MANHSSSRTTISTPRGEGKGASGGEECAAPSAGLDEEPLENERDGSKEGEIGKASAA